MTIGERNRRSPTHTIARADVLGQAFWHSTEGGQPDCQGSVHLGEVQRFMLKGTVDVSEF